MRSGVVLAGRYRLDQPIAVGGMGQVWRATDQVLERQVAIKLLRPEYADHPETLTRFRSEARHAASLTHAGIAQVHDYGEAGSHGPPYLVMELVDGPSLLTVLAAGPASPAYALDVIGQVASALAAAHRAGVVHRDVKPANILLGPDGQVKITDFGIAHAAGSAPITDPRLMMGTCQYLAPERIAGGPGTPASDLYSLGIVLHECLTGVPPFEGSAAEVMASHLYVPLPPLPAEVAPEVRELAAWLTAKDPAQRLSDAAELAATAHRLRTALAARTSGSFRQRQGLGEEPGPDARTVPMAHVRRPAGAPVSGPDPAAAMWEPAVPPAAGPGNGGFPVNPLGPGNGGFPVSPLGTRERLAGRQRIWVPRSATLHLKASLTGRAVPLVGAGRAALAAGRAALAAGASLLVGAARPSRQKRRVGWAAVLAALLVVLSLAGREIYASVQRGNPQGASAALSTHRDVAPSRVRSTASPVPSQAETPSPAATPSAAQPAVQLLTPAKAVAFGPSGPRDGDNPSTADRALGRGTGWLSQWYATAAFGNLKKGTGLLVDMGAVVSITSVSVQLGRRPGATIELDVGDEPVKAALHTVKRVTNASQRVVVQFPAVRAHYFLIWYTKLPPNGTGTYQANIAGIVVRGYR